MVIQMIVTFSRYRHYRELDVRECAGVTVRLLWDPRRDVVIVHVHDRPREVEFTLWPPRDRARYVFHHPFAVAHLLDSDRARLAA